MVVLTFSGMLSYSKTSIFEDNVLIFENSQSLLKI